MRSSWKAWAVLFLFPLLFACDLLMAPPAEETPETTIAFSLEELPLGRSGLAFDKADRVYLLFSRPDSVQRDTIVPLSRSDGLARARLVLDPRERVDALGVYAQLMAGPAGLFEGFKIVRVVLGEPTTAQIPLAPIPAHLVADRHLLAMTVGDTIRLSAALLFATGDTISRGSGQWLSDNGQVAAVSAAGLAWARAPGATLLRVGFQELRDSVLVQVSPAR